MRHAIDNRGSGDLTATFFESQGMAITTAMYNWINAIATYKSDTDNFRRAYLDDIKAEIRIFPIQNDGEIAPRFHRFTDVFPISSGPTNFDFQADNEIGKLSVRFKYRYHLLELS